MCDTFVIVESGRVLFGKNSDRHPAEAQAITWAPAIAYPADSQLRCTWRDIPQVEHTLSVCLCRPHWMWGAEMGFNEHGVVIGNEAIFAHEPLQEDGLLGMDLVRLGLERGASAAEAKDVICDLVSRYGQGGRCSLENARLSYHNSFLVADTSGAWAIEAIGKQVASKRINAGVYAISNGITLPDFESRQDRLRGWVAQARSRRDRVKCLAGEARSVIDAMNVLRDHGSKDGLPRYSRINGAMSAPCMHDGGWLVSSQTVGSLVSELRPDVARHWVTGTAAPCLSLFRPIDLRERDMPSPTATPNTSLWWRFEAVHRAMLGADAARRRQFLQDRDAVQAQLLDMPDDGAWRLADEWLERWRATI